LLHLLVKSQTRIKLQVKIRLMKMLDVNVMKSGECCEKKTKEIEEWLLPVRTKLRKNAIRKEISVKKLHLDKLSQLQLEMHSMINVFSTNLRVFQAVLVMKKTTICMKNHFLLTERVHQFTRMSIVRLELEP